MFYKSVIFILLLSSSLFGQIVKFSAFPVTASDTIEELRKIKTANPKLSAQELSKNGDELISAKGLNFIFSFNTELCQKVTDAMQKQKDKASPIRFNAQINSVDGDIASITLPEIKFATAGCGTCFVQMPLAEFSDKEFVSFIQNRIVRFHTPKNLFYEEIYLVDSKNTSTVLRNWKIPFRTAPIGISDDGKMIILDLPFDELKEIALLIYDDGTFRFYPKSELDLTAKSEILKSNSNQTDTVKTSLISFSKGEQIQILKFNNKCQ